MSTEQTTTVEGGTAECPSWCTDQHLESGTDANPRKDVWHRSADMTMDVIPSGSPARALWRIETNRDGEPEAWQHEVTIENGLSVAELREVGAALLKMADEMDRITEVSR